MEKAQEPLQKTRHGAVQAVGRRWFRRFRLYELPRDSQDERPPGSKQRLLMLRDWFWATMPAMAHLHTEEVQLGGMTTGSTAS
jgi:hypothetical protein